MMQQILWCFACCSMCFALAGYPQAFYCCCEDEPENCPHACTGCHEDSLAADEYEVVISGVTNNGCTGCSGWDGTWILTHDTTFTHSFLPVPTDPEKCNFVYELSSGERTGFQNRAGFSGCQNSVAAYLWLQFFVNPATPTTSRRRLWATACTTTTAPHQCSQGICEYSFEGDEEQCCEIEGESIAFVSQAATWCDFSGATVTVSAVPPV